jgi:hypothetical protein
LSVVALAALPGCAFEFPTAEKPVAAAPAQLAAVVDPPPEPEMAPKKPPPKKVAARPRPKANPQVANVQPQAGTSAAEPKPEPEPEPMNLVGLDEQQLTSLLGAPTEKEEPTPAKVWRYRRAGCTLDVTLFPDVITRTYRSLAYEVTSNDNTAESKRACVSQRHVDAGTQ